MKTKRQKIRTTSLIIAFLLLPIILFYFSPYLPFHGIISGDSVLTGSAIVFCVLLLQSIFFGRLFCGWACSTGGLQEIFLPINNTPVKRGIGKTIKWAVWTLWLLGWIYLAVKNNGFEKVDFFYQTQNGISVTSLMAYIIYFAVVGIIVIGSLFVGRRSFCHYACWMAPFMIIGSKCGRACKLPSVKLNIKKENCVSCGKCDKACPMSINVQEQINSGFIKDTDCILCGNCVDVCNNRAIEFGFGKLKG